MYSMRTRPTLDRERRPVAKRRLRRAMSQASGALIERSPRGHSAFCNGAYAESTLLSRPDGALIEAGATATQRRQVFEPCRDALHHCVHSCRRTQRVMRRCGAELVDSDPEPHVLLLEPEEIRNVFLSLPSLLQNGACTAGCAMRTALAPSDGPR